MAEMTCAFDDCGPTPKLIRGLCRAHYDMQRFGRELVAVRWRRGAKAGASCSFDGCGRAVKSMGLCQAHYRQRQAGTVLKPLRQLVPSGGPCGYGRCGRAASARGLCRSHYAQQLAGRELTTIRRIRGPLTLRDRDGRKQCSACDGWKPEDEFGKNSTTSDGLQGRCDACTRAAYLERTYSLTADAYAGLLDRQGGVCAICKQSDPAGRALAVDHDHTCCPGETSCGACVRGLACWNCNVGIGHLGDNPQVLRAAADYLDASRSASRLA